MGNHISLREWVRAPLPYAGESVQLVTLPGSALGPWAELQHSEPEVPLHLGTAPLYLQQFLIRGQVLQFLLQATGLHMQCLQCRSCWQMPERPGCLGVGSPSEASPTPRCSLHTQSPWSINSNTRAQTSAQDWLCCAWPPGRLLCTLGSYKNDVITQLAIGPASRCS